MTVDISTFGRCKSPEHLAELLARFYSQVLEEFAALASPSLGGRPALGDFYAQLRMLRPEQVGAVVRHPLFTWAVRSIARATGSPTEAHGADAEAAIGALLLDAATTGSQEAHGTLLLDSAGRVVLPFSGVVIDAGLENGGLELYMHSSANGTTVSIDTFAVALDRSCNAHMRSFDVPGLGLVRVWTLRSMPLRSDWLTTAYRKNLPAGWRMAQRLDQWAVDWPGTVSRMQGLIGASAESFWWELTQLVSTVVPVECTALERHLSSSCIDLPGVIYMSWTRHVLQFVEAAVHEAAHNKLYLFEVDGPFVAQGGAKRLRSPWRADLRPPRGLIHGAYAFASVGDLWVQLLDEDAAVSDSQNLRLRRACAEISKDVTQAVTTLRAHCALTERGAALIDLICATIDNMRTVTKSGMHVAAAPPTKVGFSPIPAAQLSRLSGDDQTLFEEIKRRFPSVAELAVNTYEVWDRSSRNIILRPWLRAITMRTVDIYFLKWCLPLAEISPLRIESDDAAHWMAAHIDWGMLWRYWDLSLDMQVDSPQAQVECHTAALTLAPILRRHALRLGMRWDRRLWAYASFFQIYCSMNERTGTLRHTHIWRRATPFLIVPQRLFQGVPGAGVFYKQYMNLLGVLDDLVDLEEDLANGRRTWVQSQVGTLPPPVDAVRKLSDVSRHYYESLSAFVADTYPISEILIDDAWAALRHEISTLERQATGRA